MTMKATNYHNEETDLKIGDVIEHVDDNGNIHRGKIIGIEPDGNEKLKVTLSVKFNDGEEGFEQSTTCYKG